MRGWWALCTLIPWEQPSLRASAGAGECLFYQKKDHAESRGESPLRMCDGSGIQCPPVSLKDTLSKLLPLFGIARCDVAQ